METAEPYLAWEGPLGEGGLGLSVVAGSNSLQLEVGYWIVNSMAAIPPYFLNKYFISSQRIVIGLP